MSRYAQVVLSSVAYAGSGDVLRVQELLELAGEHIEHEEGDAWKVGGCVHHTPHTAVRMHGTCTPWALMYWVACPLFLT